MSRNEKFLDNLSEHKLELFEKIQQLKFEQNEYIAMILNYYAFPKDSFENIPEYKDRLNQTEFSNISNEELFAKFNKEIFNNLPTDELEHLFQEVHNRMAINNDTEVQRICKIDELEDQVLATTYFESNRIIINKDKIESAKKTPFGVINKNNLGIQYLLNILHETQHNVQFNNSLKYVLNLTQSPQEDFMGAVSLMLTSLDDYARHNNNEELNERLYENYWYSYEEHNANYYAIKMVKEMFDNGSLKNYNSAMALQYFIEETLMIKSNFVDYDKIIKRNQEEMENVIYELYEDFNKYISDCDMKDKLMQTVKAYIAKNAKGNSMLSTQLNKDLKYFVKTLKEAKSYRNTHEDERELF